MLCNSVIYGSTVVSRIMLQSRTQKQQQHMSPKQILIFYNREEINTHELK